MPRLGAAWDVRGVTEAIPVIETARTVQSNTYDERTARSIPIAGRSLLDFFVLQPGVNAPPLSTGGSGTGTPSTVYGGTGFRQMNALASGIRLPSLAWMKPDKVASVAWL